MARSNDTSRFPTVRIDSADGRGYGTKVFVDEVEQTGLTSVHIDMEATDVNRVTMERFARVMFDGLAKVDDLWRVTAIITRAGPKMTTSEFTGSGSSVAEAIRDIAVLVGRAERIESWNRE